jgi:hypothetical protein
MTSGLQPNRVLAIDVGLWNLSYCICEELPSPQEGESIAHYEVLDWNNLVLTQEAGFPMAGRDSAVKLIDLTQPILMEMAFDVLLRMFPPAYVRHAFHTVSIENQVRKNGMANKITELGMAIFSYFKRAAHPEAHCCWRFPDVHLQSPGVKFDEKQFFGLEAKDHAVLPKRANYNQRKRYSAQLVTNFMTKPHIHIRDELRIRYRNARKQDDLADAMLLAGIALR